MIYIMVIFSAIAGIDKILNNRFGLGEKFDEGFKSLGGLAVSIIGIYSLSPIIAKALVPILNPIANVLNTDPSVFIGSLLAPDLGGYNTSVEIALNKSIGEFNGLMLSSMLGTVISFTIPISVELIPKEDFNYFAKGVLAGIMTIPIGMVVAGIMMGIEFIYIVFNLIPVIIFSALIIIGIFKIPNTIVRIFNVIGKVIIAISTFGLIVSILNFMFEVEIINGLIPLEEGAILVVKIGIILSGAYPMFHFISRALQRYLTKLGSKLELDEYSILGIFSSLAHSIPMLGIYDKMNEKGKIINAAFAVSASYVFGGQLGYISSVSPENVNAYIVSKLVAGISAVIVAILIIKLEKTRGVKDGN
ncbi:ethanolamine utilization protein EutH [Tissierella pigra]|uniref:Ethanolamine utilization protein EutH n=1 Tax=Tissierella pigra TaxID=2607614 RepID=A0A6N7XWC5_9FIRM|nr:ethanolamine utilization protein EutH [Tissierella pigra]MBU5426094.1 ethanolamine utilization protein EutH [Tissierella pigra]MSU00785.1 ethanolamine utilization protein EutH [Tissierella pigra]